LIARANRTSVLVVRYERQRPGELIHLDTKKLGRIKGIGHRISGRRSGAINRHHGTDWEALHVPSMMPRAWPIPSCLPTRKKDSALAFVGRALDLVRPSRRRRRADHDRQRLGLQKQ
jgi:hypothetical protein